MKLESLTNSFINYFQTSPDQYFFAPGRINLIGEHTDYNGGKVFPLAITSGTYALARKREDRKIRMVSLNFEDQGVVEVSLDALEYNTGNEWVNYPNGVTKLMVEKGSEIENGFDVLFYGNIPNGAGLSSSASIEMATGVMLQGLFQIDMDRVELIKLCQQVENEFIGVNSGIMDQFAIGMGKEGQAIWLDCETLAYEYAPLELIEEQIVIINTNKRRELASSKYNERRSECEAALKELQPYIQAEALGEISSETFESIKQHLSSETLVKRAKHVIYENERTEKALHQLKAGNLKAVGELMNDSHRSLKNDYEVTGKELDTIVEFAWEQEGVIGARMTGAGFGGCAIAIVKTNHIPAFIDYVGAHYTKECGLEAAFYTASVGEGAHEILKEKV
ncbi:galactokinase [Jeotgalibacillus proteolyticus]|uniref:Galactokinase n=1 Tax=Jeotgalibacillus proteolyticus TaxID=2082395 RepID=A0A2S5G9G2_9BACL|nr:galactokinase [Jeotgalibacillus proteolyticus]PPA69619.1 galactokinase [Jeotgalibacillus proteolyticus]